MNASTGDPIAPDAPVVAGIEAGEAMADTVAWAAGAAARGGRPLLLVHVVDHVAETFEQRRDAESYGAAYLEPGSRELSGVHALEWTPRVYGDAGLATVDVRRAHSLDERVRAAGYDLLSHARAVASQAEPGVEVRVRLDVGGTRLRLAEEARAAAMLVIGTRSLSTVAELLTVGSVASPLTVHAPCPVVVVRPRVEPAAARPFVLVGVDGSPGCSGAVAFAFEEAAARRAELAAVLVDRTMGPIDHIGRAERVKSGWRRLAESLAGWTDRYPDVPVRGEVVVGHPVRVLADEARQALEVVVGARGDGGLARLGPGSVGRGLIHHAPCPVVVVPRPDA